MGLKIDIEVLRDELELFGVDVPSDDEDFIWEKVEELCGLYNIDESEFSGEWVAFISTHTEKTNFDAHNLNLLEQYLIRVKRSREKKGQAESASSQDSDDTQSVPRPTEKRVSHAEIFSLYGGAVEAMDMDSMESTESPDHASLPSTPVSVPNKKRPNRSSVAQITAGIRNNMSFESFSPLEDTPLSKTYEERENSMEVLQSFGKDPTSVQWANNAGKSAESWNLGPANNERALEKQYKYMFQKVPDIVEALIEECEEFGDKVAEKLQIEEFANARQPNQDKVVVCGQVFCEGAGKLNHSSLMLQGSMSSSMGCSVSLDVSNMNEYSFFPGQVTVLEGTNPSGRLFIAEKQISGFVPPQYDIVKPGFNFERMSVVVACGPFTTTDSVAYQPLCDLLKYVSEHKPDLLILIGPFVDVKSAEIAEAKVHRTFTDLFERILTRISDMTQECVGTEVVIVPSAQREAHHDPVYPCPPFKARRAASKLHERIHLVSDPCMLNFGGVVLGITGTDILMHLGAEEISVKREGQSMDRMSRLLRQMMLQGSFYPLYPPPLDLNVEFQLARKHCAIDKLPHLLITPSDLRYFLKDVEGVCCVNPGRLARGKSGGYFGRFCIDLKNLSKNETSVVEKTNAQILRI